MKVLNKFRITVMGIIAAILGSHSLISYGKDNCQKTTTIETEDGVVEPSTR